MAVRFLAVILAVITVFCGFTDVSAAGLFDGFFGLGQCEDEGYYRKELSEGVKNSLLRARQMYEIEWTPLEDLYMYENSETTAKLFKAGITYMGAPYGQPVHEGKYIGIKGSTGVTLEAFVEAVKDVDSDFYELRGQNTWYYESQTGDGKIRFGPYMASDCSSFVSYCWDLDSRTTTALFEADPETFIVVGNNVQQLETGYAINKGGAHIILIYDVVYNKAGEVVSVTTMEQTPPIMTMRTYGLGGTTGTLADLQAKMDTGYDIIRYKHIENVKYAPDSTVKVAEKTYVGGVELPVSDSTVDGPATGNITVAKEQTELALKGWAFHKDGIKTFKYSINGGKAKSLKAEYNPDYCAPNTIYYDFAGCKGKNSYSGTISLDFEENAEVVVLGVTNGGEEIEVAKINVKKSAEKETVMHEVYFEEPWIYPDSDGVCRTEIKAESEEDFIVKFKGWSVCEKDILRFEMSIDGGMWLPVETVMREDVYKSKKADYPECRNNNGFVGAVDLRYLGTLGTHEIVLRAVTDDNNVYEVAVWSLEAANAGIIKIACVAGLGALLIAVIITVTVILKKKSKKRKEADDLQKDDSTPDLNTEDSVETTEPEEEIEN